MPTPNTNAKIINLLEEVQFFEWAVRHLNTIEPDDPTAVERTIAWYFDEQRTANLEALDRIAKRATFWQKLNPLRIFKR